MDAIAIILAVVALIIAIAAILLAFLYKRVGPQGPVGSVGPTGPVGPPGPSALSEITRIPSDQSSTVNVRDGSLVVIEQSSGMTGTPFFQISTAERSDLVYFSIKNRSNNSLMLRSVPGGNLQWEQDFAINSQQACSFAASLENDKYIAEAIMCGTTF
jgi:hypothetical protein